MNILNSGSNLPGEEGATSPKITGDEKKNARKQLWCVKWRQNSLRATALFPSAQILNRACITRDEHIKPCWVVFIVQHQEGFGVKAQMLRSSEGISRHCHRNFTSLWHYLSSARRSVGSTQHYPFVQTAHKLSKDCVLPCVCTIPVLNGSWARLEHWEYKYLQK